MTANVVKRKLNILNGVENAVRNIVLCVHERALVTQNASVMGNLAKDILVHL